jgi:ELWxxDGT repeat protein
MVANLARDFIDLGTGQIVPSSSEPEYLTNVNGTLFFSATDTVFQRWSTGRELWKSNGTSAGTTVVKDIVPGRGSSYPRYLTNVGSTVYFGVYTASGEYELWKSLTGDKVPKKVAASEIEPRNHAENPDVYGV